MSAPLPVRNTPAHHTSSLTSSNKQTTFHRGSDQPKWVNPCGLPGHVFEETDMRNAPDSAVSVSRIFENIYKSATHATQLTNKIKRDFVMVEFRDASFEEAVQYNRQEWLPATPDPTVSHLNSLSHEEALRSTFEFLQYYAVGIEEILLDATLHDSSFRDEFQKIETYLTQLLCDVQMGMFVLHVKRNDDVLRDVMSQEYRDLPDRSSRLVRDYLILRDYAKTVNYIAELFDYLKKKL